MSFYDDMPDDVFDDLMSRGGSYTLVDLQCGCQDIYYANGTVDREHDYAECDGRAEDDDYFKGAQVDREGLWEAVLEKYRELQQSDHRGLSRGRGYWTDTKPVSVQCVCKRYEPDGTYTIFVIEAYRSHSKAGITVKVTSGNGVDMSFWTEKLRWKEANDPRQVIVDHHHYFIGDPVYSKDMRGTLGFGGRKFTIKFIDGRTVVTNNLWFQGPIPPSLREQLADNAEFLPEPKISLKDLGGTS